MVLDYQMTQMPEVTVIMMIRLIGALESSWGVRVSRSSYKAGKAFYFSCFASVGTEAARRRRKNPGTMVIRFLLTRENFPPELMGQGICCQGPTRLWVDPNTSFWQNN